VAIDSQLRTYVADLVRRDVEQYSLSGRLLRVFGRGVPVGLRLRKPIALAVDAAGSVYVADAGEERVIELSSSGRLVGSWGGSTFVRLSGVAVAPDGNVYALDGGSGDVLKLSRSKP
jgi:DNA-binding beta-propeller fold protein YncE